MTSDQGQNDENPAGETADFGAILRNSPISMVIRDSATDKVLFLNDALLEIFRISESAYRTRSHSSFYVNLAERYQWMAKLVNAGRVHDFPVTFRRADRTVFKARIWVSTIRYGDRDANQIWITEITESAQPLPDDAKPDADRLSEIEAERRAHTGQFQALFENVPISMTMKGRDGRYLHVNSQFADWIGLNVDQLIGRTAFDLFDEATAEKITKVDREIFETGAARSREFEVTRIDGKTSQVHEVKFPLRNKDGNIDMIGVAMIDRTDFRDLEVAFRQSQKMEAIGQLTGGIAHDFNNMLSIVMGNLDLIREEVGEESDISPFVVAAMHGAERGATLNRQLLAFSRRALLAPKPIDMNRQLTDMFELLQRTLGETIGTEIVLADDLWICEADPVQLESALLNLAVNARDAMPRGGHLTIETLNVVLDDSYAAGQADVQPGQYVMLGVSDTGTGMSPEIQEKAFEPFFTTKDDDRGTGLGLAMVFGFAKQSGGHVAIYSEVGEGTTIRLYLPRTEKDELVPQSMDEEIRVANGETVLVVEDEAAVREIVVKLAADLGYTVLEAVDGKEAIKVLTDRAKIDLVLTDVVLPGDMNGSQVAHAAQRIHPGIKTLFMSGYTENAIIHQGRLDEGVLLIQKPFHKKQLAKSIREALDQDE